MRVLIILIATVEVIGAIAGFFGALEITMRNDEEALARVAAVFFGAFCLGAAIASILAVRGSMLATKILVSLLAAQVPVVFSQSVAFAVFLAAQWWFVLGLHDGGPVYLMHAWGSSFMWRGGSPYAPAIGVNILPLLLLCGGAAVLRRNARTTRSVTGPGDPLQESR